MTTPTIDPILDQLRSTATLQEYRFRSQVPLIGPLIVRFRELWNGVATKWYVRPLIQHQSEVNQQLVVVLAAQAAGLRDVASRLAVDEERLANNEARLDQQETRLDQQEARLHDHDGWLIEQDREQSATICDLSDTALRLVQANKRLVELEHRLAMLETDVASPVAEQ
jgi:septal ring factor EnvC (AmiA/AmiB activator)